MDVISENKWPGIEVVIFSKRGQKYNNGYEPVSFCILVSRKFREKSKYQSLSQFVILYYQPRLDYGFYCLSKQKTVNLIFILFQAESFR